MATENPVIMSVGLLCVPGACCWWPGVQGDYQGCMRPSSQSRRRSCLCLPDPTQGGQ